MLRNSTKFSNVATFRADLGRVWPRPLLHNNQKLFERRPRHHSSVRYHQQVELRRHKQVDKGGGGARTRHPEGSRRQQTAPRIQATGNERLVLSN